MYFEQQYHTTSFQLLQYSLTGFILLLGSSLSTQSVKHGGVSRLWVQREGAVDGGVADHRSGACVDCVHAIALQRSLYNRIASDRGNPQSTITHCTENIHTHSNGTRAPPRKLQRCMHKYACTNAHARRYMHVKAWSVFDCAVVKFTVERRRVDRTGLALEDAMRRDVGDKSRGQLGADVVERCIIYICAGARGYETPVKHTPPLLQH